MTAFPALSIVLVTPGPWATITDVLACLRAQTVASQVEVVIVAPVASNLRLAPGAEVGLHGLQLIEVQAIVPVGEPRAEGVRQARSPIVVLAEDHAFLEPGWAAALIEAHRQPWAAVGPTMTNANPATMISWANQIIDYGPWVDLSVGRVMDDVPGLNSSYKRALLLDYGGRLGAMLEREGGLHRDLRARGHELYIEPAARTHHQNFSLLAPSLDLHYCSGRQFGAVRSARGRWPRWRRRLYVTASPLIPLVRLWRILVETRHATSRWLLFPRLIPMLLLCLSAAAVGEAMGYIGGIGDAVSRLVDFEFDRQRFMSERDRAASPIPWRRASEDDSLERAVVQPDD